MIMRILIFVGGHNNDDVQDDGQDDGQDDVQDDGQDDGQDDENLSGSNSLSS